MNSIMDFLDEHGVIDDEMVSYNIDGPYPFTLEELRFFTDRIWEDMGSWNESETYRAQDSHFETYYVPFSYKYKNYYLVVMYGQGTAWTLQTEAFHEDYKKRIAEINHEDSTLPDQHDAE